MQCTLNHETWHGSCLLSLSLSLSPLKTKQSSCSRVCPIVLLIIIIIFISYSPTSCIIEIPVVRGIGPQLTLKAGFPSALRGLFFPGTAQFTFSLFYRYNQSLIRLVAFQCVAAPSVSRGGGCRNNTRGYFIILQFALAKPV